MKDLTTLTKAELIELLNKKSTGNRKVEVLGLLQNGFDSIEAISEELAITKKNVSSVLSALRKQGHNIINLRIGGQSVLQLMTEEQMDFIQSKQVSKED